MAPARSHSLVLVITILFLVLPAGVLAQTTIHVPADQPSIQAGIDAAVNGDTVLVSDGTYYERIDFKGKNITVTSVNGATKTIIDGQNLGTVVSIKNGETNAAVLSGFTIQNGKGSDFYYGGGIYLGAAAIVEHNIITNNGCGEGGGVNIQFASPIVRYNSIHHNNRSPNCYPTGVGGGGVAIGGNGQAQVLYNDIYENKGGYEGGGIEMWAAGNALVEGNSIHDNYSTGTNGGGMGIENEGTSIVRNNVIYHNHGGGVYWGRMPGDFSNNTVAYNTAEQGTAEINSFSWWDGKFRNNVIVPNPGATAISCPDNSSYGITAANFTYNDVYANGGTAFTCSAPSNTNNNIAVDPLFADPIGGDFHVATGSPIIDAADPATTPVPANDAGLEPRVVNAKLDLGGYEYQGETTFTATPTDLAFGGHKTNIASDPQSVTISNTGTKALHLKTLQIGSDFLQTNDCVRAGGLAAGKSCTIAVSFDPISPGAKAETLLVAGANAPAPITVNLTGTGTAPAVTLNPTSLDFGNQALFTTSAARSITLTNSGDADLAVSSITRAGDYAQTNNCGTVAPSASCTINVTFTPTYTRTRPGGITIYDDAANAPQSVSLTGNGTGPEISFSQTSINFMSQPVGTVASPQTLTVTNTGGSDLIITALQIAGDFSQTNNCVTTIAPAATCQVTINFQPTLYGGRLGTLRFVDNAAASPQVISLSGTGTAPLVSFLYSNIDFGGPYVVGKSAFRDAVITNVGNDILIISSVLATGDFTAQNQCPDPLQPYQSCVVHTMFAPTQAGTRTGTLTFSDNAYGSPHVVQLSGFAIAAYPVPVITSVTPEVISVGSANVTISGAGFFPESIVYWDGQPIATTFQGPSYLTVTAPTSSLTDYAVHSVTVVNPSPGGGTSTAANISTMRSLQLSTRDMVYDPYRRVFYASIDSSATNSPNSVVTIDPATNSYSSPMYLGANPNQLAISDDGQFLYVALDGSSQIKRVNLYTNAVDLTIPLGSSSFGSNSVGEMHPLPGQPHSVAASLVTWGVSPPEQGGIAIFDDGVARSKNAAAPNDGLFYFTFNTDGSMIYSTSGSEYPPSLRALTVDASGVTLSSSKWSSGGSRLQFKNGLIYSGQLVYDPATLNQVGQFSFTSYGYIQTNYIEEGTHRIYLLDGNGGVRIWAGDTTTYTPTGHLQLPTNYNNYATEVFRWGSNGLAVRYYNGSTNYGGATLGDYVAFVRSAITNPSTGNNPVPTVSALLPATIPSAGPNLRLTVTGTNFVPGAVVLWNGDERTTTFVNATTLSAYIPASDIAAQGTATVTVLNPTPAGGASNAVSVPITLSDVRFVQRCFRDILDRQVDSGGLAYYVQQLQKGLSRVDFISELMGSGEFKSRERFVAQAYVAIMQREADYGGFRYYAGQIINGYTQTAMVDDFTGSAEFQQRYGSLDNSAFVTQMYNAILLRPPDPGGLAYYVNRLQNNLTRSQLVLDFMGSNEFQTNAAIQNRITVSLIYFTLLDRDADSGGYAYYDDAVNKGLLPSEMIAQFLNSGEYKGRTD